jgi:hypothetical protein
MVNIEKLTLDAKLARMLGEAAGIVAVDNGSCNLDATFLRLEKGERAAPVVSALRAAGLSASDTRWLGRGVMIQPPCDGQAGKRYAANEAMYESLKRTGWPVTPFYQMD